MEFPKTLAERLHTGKIIPFVGAGVSMSVLERETGKHLFPSWRELLGDQHPDTVLVAHNLAQALSNLSRQKEALRFVNEFLRKIPQDHPHHALLKHLQPKLLAKALPSGFRQPSKKNLKQKTKTKKNRG